MTEANNSDEVLGLLPELERTVRIAQALGADTVYPLVEKPSIIDLITGSIQVDRSNPIIINESISGVIDD